MQDSTSDHISFPQTPVLVKLPDHSSHAVRKQRPTYACHDDVHKKGYHNANEGCEFCILQEGTVMVSLISARAQRQQSQGMKGKQDSYFPTEAATNNLCISSECK